MAILPELMLLLAALAFFALSLGKDLQADQMSNAALFMSFIVLVCSLISRNQELTLFSACYQVDSFSQLFKIMISLGLFFVLVASQQLKGIEISVRPEYYMFLFLSSLGLMALVSAVELITLFVALELSSFALYIMVAMRDDQTGTRMQMEAGIKYLFFGVLATGCLLFGMSYMFGLTGTTYLQGIFSGLQAAPQPAAFFSVIMVLAAFFFKLAIFPMHFWVPDVYAGAANETTTFAATLPKLGAVALLIRLIALVPAYSQLLVHLLAVLAVCSMFYGNLLALVQTDLKRMLGFSAIAHAGFVLLGLLTLDKNGYAAAIYYIAGYVFMNLACYTVINTLSSQGENVVISDVDGLYKRDPLLAFLLAVGMFSLAGIPPMVGFMGEMFLLAGALKADHLLLVVFAALNAGIAIYYYLRVVKAAFTGEGRVSPALVMNPMTRIGSVLLVLLILFMGVFPATFLAFADAAVQAVL